MLDDDSTEKYDYIISVNNFFANILHDIAFGSVSSHVRILDGFVTSPVDIMSVYKKISKINGLN